VWHCVVPNNEIANFRKQFCGSHSVRQADGFHLRVVSQQTPCMGATYLALNLEDAYSFYSKNMSTSLAKKCERGGMINFIFKFTFHIFKADFRRPVRQHNRLVTPLWMTLLTMLFFPALMQVIKLFK
jgi:hypothetical protein